MSWAALLANSKEKTLVSDVPQSVVYGRDNTLPEEERALQNVEHETVATVSLPEYTKGLLILDANAIIKGMDNFNSIADAFVTTSQVVNEIRDKASKELMDRLPHALVVLDPTAASVRAVVKMAERTGDLGVLSRTDIRLCALALDCCKAGNVMLDPIEPRAADENPDSKNGPTVHVVTEAVSDVDEGEEEAPAEQHQQHGEEGPVAEGDAPASGAEEEGNGDAEDDDDDDDGDWITPENIHEMGADGTRNAQGTESFQGGMACVTSDYAMQNTMMHLGVPIMGSNGMRIKQLRLWLLRCTACFTLVMDTTRQFCPSCGSGDTLRRVNYVVNTNGDRHLFINFKKKISKRGTIYSLPKPRGGKHGTNRTLVLREDQLAHVIRGTSGAKMKERQAVAAFGDDDDLAGFGEAPQRRKKNLGAPKATSSYHRYNVNEKRKQRAARHK